MQASTNQGIMNFGLDSIFFRSSFLWKTLGDSIKREKTLACFQKEICKWTGATCSCKVCPEFALHTCMYNFLVFIILYRFAFNFSSYIVGLN